MSYFGSALRITAIDSEVHYRHFWLHSFRLVQRRTVDPEEPSMLNIVIMKHVGLESIPLPFQIQVNHSVSNRRNVRTVTDLIQSICQRKCDPVPIKEGSNFLNNFGPWTVEKQKTNYIRRPCLNGAEAMLHYKQRIHCFHLQKDKKIINQQYLFFLFFGNAILIAYGKFILKIFRMFCS